MRLTTWPRKIFEARQVSSTDRAMPGFEHGLVGFVADDDRLAELFEEGLPQHAIAVVQEGARNADDAHVG